MKKILALLVTMSVATSCDVLDQVPESAFTPTNFYKNSDDAIAAISSVYDQLNTQDLYNQVMWIVQDQATDDAEWGGGRSTANQAKNDLDKYTFTPATSTFQSTWSAQYRAINRANAAIERIPGITMDPALQGRLIAEAKFMRAFYYFTLVRFFGDVPLTLTETTSLTDLAMSRTPKEEVYAQVIKDFTEAEAVLPATYSGGDRGRATKGAATAFLAKVYLTRKDWTNAAAKAKQVIDSGLYDLWPTYAEAFSIANKNGKEAVFEVQALGGGFGEGSWMQGYMRPNFDRVNNISGFGDDPVTKNLYETYTAADKRRDVNIRVYSATTTPAAPASVDFPGYVYKYLDPSATGNNEGSNNFPVIRYADVLLMYAEALNELGAGNAEAFTVVNRIRTRAGLAALPSSLGQAAFRDAIALERRLELAFEGHRWFDLVRTGKLVEAIKAQNPTIQVTQDHLLLPIPQTERDVNPNLTQNPGY